MLLSNLGDIDSAQTPRSHCCCVTDLFVKHTYVLLFICTQYALCCCLYGSIFKVPKWDECQVSTYRFWFRENTCFLAVCSKVGKHCYWCPRTVDDLKKESRKKNPILHSTDRAHDVMYNLLFRPVQRNNNTVPSSVRLFSVKCFLSFTINCHAALSFMFTLFAHPVFIVACIIQIYSHLLVFQIPGVSRSEGTFWDRSSRKL